MSKPFIYLPESFAAPLLCFCDHATNCVPKTYNNLGLNVSDLNRHIGWDIGAANLTKRLYKTLGGSGVLAGYSRLLIDLNRDLGDTGLIPRVSDGIPIPGNQDLTGTDIAKRIKHYYEPYHQALAQKIDKTLERHDDPLIVSIHSFTPEPAHGKRRQLDIGLLWKVDEDNAKAVQTEIKRVHPYKIALNEPYSALTLNHTMDRHVLPRGLRHITLEIRQDLIDTDAGAAKMAKHLSQALRHFIGD